MYCHCGGGGGLLISSKLIVFVVGAFTAIVYFKKATPTIVVFIAIVGVLILISELIAFGARLQCIVTMVFIVIIRELSFLIHYK